MTITAINSNHENYLNHIIWLKSEPWQAVHNLYTASEVLNYIDALPDRKIDMATVEKIFYHYITNDFSRTPYKKFDCTLYQNANHESTDNIEEIKLIMCLACGLDTQFFHEDVQAKHKDFKLILK